MTRPFLTVVEPSAVVAGDLPRMDVAAFAGFAGSGPFGLPVCVESPAAFAAVFGSTLMLPGGRGRLADAVGAFFAQGGRRAWIVRCGDAATAPVRFPLPGVLALRASEPSEDDDGVRVATLAARSPGTAFDDQRVAVEVQRTRIVVEPRSTGIRIDAAVEPGTLVELTVARGAAVGRRFAVLGAPTGTTFALQSPVSVMPAPVLDAALAGTVEGRPAWMARDALGVARITVSGAAPAIGALVRFDPELARPPLPARKLHRPEPPTWVLVEDVSAPSPGASTAALELSGRAVHVDRDPAGTLQAGVGAALALALRGRDWRLDGLGCTPATAGWAGALPSDAERYADADGPTAAATAPVCGAGLVDVAALVPIFDTPYEAAPAAVGGPADVATAGDGVAAGDSPTTPLGAEAVRNGLTGTVVDALLGGEARLDGRSVAGLAALVRSRDQSDPGPPLPGILALTDALEATLLAVPDAIVGDPDTTVAPVEPPVRLPALDIDGAAAGFGLCAALPATPTLHDAEPRKGAVALSWVALGAAEYEVGRFVDEAATDAAAVLYRGPAEVTGSGITPDGDPAPVFGLTLAAGARGWARVRALDATGRAGGWSIGVPLPLPLAGELASAQDSAPEALLAVHATLLRIAALRGDSLAVLSVPVGWTVAEARDHTAALQAQVGEHEPLVLGFGTLAHPWPRVPVPAPAVVTEVPPDAVLAGQLAAMALARGPWIAVSDRPLRAAVDIAERTGAAASAGPLVRYVVSPRGVSADGQDTLALDRDARPVNVRRLLGLLHRAALERGRATVFEPNGPALWRALHRDLEGLLGQLHERGAFGPERAVEAYRVDVFPGDGRGDDGRCVCELRVAPSLPLRFLTVRLERQDDGALTAGTR